MSDPTGWTAGRQECVRLYPAPLGLCEHDCGAEATDHHHRDGDTSNNIRANVEFLCRRCHMVADGRLASLVAYSPPREEPKPCANCGRPYKPLRRGRCQPCAVYLRRTGHERPYVTDGRREQAIARMDELLALEHRQEALL